MTKEKTPREKHREDKLSILGSFEDVIRQSVTSGKSTEIGKAIIAAKRKDFGFDPSVKFQNTSFTWLEQNVPGYSREEIIAALVDMNGVEVVDSMAGAIRIPKLYFE